MPNSIKSSMARTFFKGNAHLNLVGKAAYSILIGVCGTIFLVLFLGALMGVFHVVSFIPWIIAFNTAITGYSLVDKTGDRLKYKQISAVSAGIMNVLITYVLLSLVFVYSAGEYLFSVRALGLFLAIGVVCSDLGALLAIKYFRLNR